jgi:hypothetical protein
MRDELTLSKHSLKLPSCTTNIVQLAIVQNTVRHDPLHILDEFLSSTVLTIVEFRSGSLQVHGFLDDCQVAERSAFAKINEHESLLRCTIPNRIHRSPKELATHMRGLVVRQHHRHSESY